MQPQVILLTIINMTVRINYFAFGMLTIIYLQCYQCLQPHPLWSDPRFSTHPSSSLITHHLRMSSPLKVQHCFLDHHIRKHSEVALGPKVCFFLLCLFSMQLTLESIQLWVMGHLLPSRPQVRDLSYTLVSHLCSSFCTHILIFFFTVYSPSGYNLPFPEATKELRDRAFELWTPPSTKCLLGDSDHQTMPTHVLGAAGVPKAKFWDMWEVCYGCDYIVLHSKMKDHGCDLTIGE